MKHAETNISHSVCHVAVTTVRSYYHYLDITSHYLSKYKLQGTKDAIIQKIAERKGCLLLLGGFVYFLVCQRRSTEEKAQVRDVLKGIEMHPMTSAGLAKAE